MASGRKSEKIITDQGTEFFNQHFKALLKDKDIELYNTYNETKASVVERLIRTLKTRMWRYFTAKKTMRYIDMLPDLVYSYNHTIHRSIVNNFLHSLFKQVDAFLKEKQVMQATGTYAYRAYLETLLNYGPAAKESQLTVAMFYKDTAGKMDVADPTLAAANANMGLKKRYAFNQESGVIEMAGSLFCDVFKSERLLLSFVELEFCVMSDVDDADYRVKLTGPTFTEFLNKHCDQSEFNNRKLQSDWSDVCGHYCISYLSHRARGQSMKKIVQLFGNDTVLNDSKVLWFVKTHFRVALKQPSVGFVQCCKKLIQ